MATQGSMREEVEASRHSEETFPESISPSIKTQSRFKSTGPKQCRSCVHIWQGRGQTYLGLSW